ncbi:unnamed protein product [Spirodela intermedia]|uniref:Uncharacterized protein n=1 Tax=Spirodela intermedia TaxID=51605 RepID=A0A7I8JWH9_SPIIN|nr:unnamed protein product [Spirodela intermedia]
MGETPLGSSLNRAPPPSWRGKSQHQWPLRHRLIARRRCAGIQRTP